MFPHTYHVKDIVHASFCMKALIRTFFQLFFCWFICGLLFTIGFRYKFLLHPGYVSLNISAFMTIVSYFIIIIIQNLIIAKFKNDYRFSLPFVVLAITVTLFFFPISYITSDSPRSALIFSTGFISSYSLTVLLFRKEKSSTITKGN